MAAPRWMAAVNGKVTNQMLGRLARRAPGFAVVVHQGHRTGRVYRTPINVFRARDGYVVALTFGREAGWVRNVMAAGHCELETRGRSLSLGSPHIFHDEGRRSVPPLIRMMLRLLGVADFLELSPAAVAGVGQTLVASGREDNKPPPAGARA